MSRVCCTAIKPFERARICQVFMVSDWCPILSKIELNKTFKFCDYNKPYEVKLIVNELIFHSRNQSVKTGLG